MSRKSRRNHATPDAPAQPAAAPRGGISRRNLFIGGRGGAAPGVRVGGAVLQEREGAGRATAGGEEPGASRERPFALFGKPDAKVHIVEFLDPGLRDLRRLLSGT